MKVKKNKQKEFNILICGTGGQGLITLLQVIAEAALIEGRNVRTSELHGLSQRGGSVEVHIRFGRKIYSPLISQNKADLILGLEMQESLVVVDFAGPQTNFLINKHIIPIALQKNKTEEEILTLLKKVGQDTFIVPANEICQKELGTGVVAGIYLIGFAVSKKLIPLKPSSFLKAFEKVIPQKYLGLNIKAFTLASKTNLQ